MILIFSALAGNVNAGANAIGPSRKECGKRPKEVDVRHPGRADCFTILYLGERRYSLGVTKNRASVDFDEDGRIGPSEEVELGAEMVEWNYAIEYKGSIIRSSLWVGYEDGRVALKTNFERRLSLPDGTAARLVSYDGVFDHEEAYLAVDTDGNGHPNHDLLSRYRVSEGIVETRDQRWLFEPSVDGLQLTLQETTEPATGLHIGSPAPDFELEASDGETYSLEDFRGKPVILDFWATWCGPCIAVHPEVVEVATEHDVAVFGISADVDQRRLNAWLAKHPTPWPSTAVGPAGEVNQAYGVSGWPTHALVDADGTMVALGHWLTVRRAIEAL